jgi:GTPase involved in cell partitioning and DNA repair
MCYSYCICTHDLQNGQGKGRHAAAPKDIHVRVPPGTVVRDQDGILCGELTEHGQEMVVAKGGRGGRGNLAFKTERNNAPKVCTILLSYMCITSRISSCCQ